MFYLTFSLFNEIYWANIKMCIMHIGKPMMCISQVSRIMWRQPWTIGGFPGGTSGKEPVCLCRRHKRQVRSLGRDSLEEGMATHSSILAWRILWTEELSGLQSMGSQRDMTEATQHGMGRGVRTAWIKWGRGFRISLGVSWCLHTYWW